MNLAASTSHSSGVVAEAETPVEAEAETPVEAQVETLTDLWRQPFARSFPSLLHWPVTHIVHHLGNPLETMHHRLVLVLVSHLLTK